MILPRALGSDRAMVFMICVCFALMSSLRNSARWILAFAFRATSSLVTSNIINLSNCNKMPSRLASRPAQDKVTFTRQLSQAHTVQAGQRGIKR